MPCTCRKGIERDNCPSCEGTGNTIDFRAFHRNKALDPPRIPCDICGLPTPNPDTICDRCTIDAEISLSPHNHGA